MNPSNVIRNAFQQAAHSFQSFYGNYIEKSNSLLSLPSIIKETKWQTVISVAWALISTMLRPQEDLKYRVTLR